MKTVRCAIYTRKSSEEGLEQDFNSLDAQHAACSAYVASQASEGWRLLPARYDDGGISGGTLERPALQRLLADIAARRIDIVVVYKVDRLTRALLDFAKLVERFDASATSFVSVTQSFNTTTSMGRLTLNMLLSFAQFEREVTAERIRDKLAASKQRGMWMGGTPPLGYKPNRRTLAIVEDQAELVQRIFKLYLDLGSVRLLQNELKRSRTLKPIRLTQSGRRFGGTAFSRGELYAILSNPIYIGRIRHRETTYKGQHKPVVDQSLWDEAQQLLAENRTGTRHRRSAAHPALLAGKLFDISGEAMVATHAQKGPRRYRYYVTRGLHRGDAGPLQADSSSRMSLSLTDAGGQTGHADRSGLRIPAQEIETLACKTIADLFDDPVSLIDRLGTAGASSDLVVTAASEGNTVVRIIDGNDARRLVPLIDAIVDRVEIATDKLTLTLNAGEIAKRLGIAAPSQRIMTIGVPAQLKRSGAVMRLLLPTGQSALPEVDHKLVAAIATARGWWKELVDDPAINVTDLAKRHAVTESWVTRILRLAFLAPGIIEATIAGRAPASLTLETLRSPESIPACWTRQRDLHRIASRS